MLFRSEGDILVPLVLAFGHLADDKADGGHAGRHQGGQHEETETPNQALVVDPTHLGHGRNGALFLRNGAEHLVDQDTKVEEVDAGRDTGKNDEAQGQIGPQVGGPNGGKGVAQLNAAFTKVKDEEAKTADHDEGQVFPIAQQAIALTVRVIVVDQVFAGKDEPEGHQSRIKDACKIHNKGVSDE